MTAQQLADIGDGDNVVILGLGVTGLLHVQLARAMGAGQVIGITRSAWKREVADRLGTIGYEVLTDLGPRVERDLR